MASELRPGGSTRRWRRLRERVLADNPTCAYCGDPATTVDHLVPRARGGGDAPANLVPACAPCNLTRGDRGSPARPSRTW